MSLTSILTFIAVNFDYNFCVKYKLNRIFSVLVRKIHPSMNTITFTEQPQKSIQCNYFKTIGKIAGNLKVLKLWSLFSKKKQESNCYLFGRL